MRDIILSILAVALIIILWRPDAAGKWWYDFRQAAQTGQMQ